MEQPSRRQKRQRSPAKRAMLALATLLALCVLLLLITEGWNLLPEGYARQFWQAVFNH